MRGLGRFSGKSLVQAGIAVAVILAGVFALLWFLVFPNSVQSAGNPKEAGIAAAYEDGANALSACVNQTNASAEAALANATEFEQIVQEAVSRTGNAQPYQMSNKDGSANATGQSGVYALFVQAYPDATKGVTSMFHTAVENITTCQSKYEAAQSQVLDRVRDFDAWRTGGWMQRTFWSGQANDNLIIPIPGTRTVYTGDQALALARVPIVNGVTSAAYQSGQYNPGNPFGSPSAAPSASASN